MKSEAAHCANMMDCHIWSAAHNATITGPKCRVCAAFTIEMRRSVGIEILVISFPPRAEGKRFSWAGGRQVYPRRAAKTQTSNSSVSTPISKWPFKGEQRANTAGRDFCVGVCDSGSFVCCSPWAKQASVAHGSHLIPHWRRDGERMAAVRGSSIAALCHVQSYLHQWC